jgi:autophagy-related protein 27
MDAKWERLKASKSHADEGKEGLRMELNGGFRKDQEGNKRKQKAIIEFICDPNKTGLENLWDPEDKYDDDDEEEAKKRDDKEEDEKKNTNKNYDPEASSLKYISYKEDATDSNIDVLRLEWLTKHACEDEKEKEDAEKSSHWGFFTWFILM